MEQTIRRIESPYRVQSRKNESTEKILKYWSKFIIQTIISAVILVTFLYCRSVNAITTSAFWEKTTAILENDISVEDMKSGIEKGMEYVRIIIPKLMESEEIKNEEILNEDKNVNNNIDNTGNVVESTENTQDEDTKNMTQEEKDIYDILKVMTVLRPVNGEISSAFGDRIDPITKKAGAHTGIDYAVAVGTQVKSAITGTVVEVEKNNASFGNFVRVKNSDIVTTYAHCSAIKVKEGDKVKQGDIVALSGNTGKTSGPHLHFEVSKNGRLINPEKLTN